MISFKNILIPVDTFESSSLAVQKAISLCNATETTIHLVTNIKVGVFTQFYSGLTGHQSESLRRKKVAIRAELQNLKSKIKREGKTIRFVSVIQTKGNFQTFLKAYLLMQRIDLIVKTPVVHFIESSIFLKSLFFLLPKQTGIPVLTVSGEYALQSSRSILIPINGYINERKVKEAIGIARKYNSQIHIITLLDDSRPNVNRYIDSFYLAYKLFSDFGHSPQYKIMIGHNREEILLRYAKEHSISMIFSNTDKEPQPFIAAGKKILRSFHLTEKIHVLTPFENMKSSA